jgi:hypothetical protein
MYIIKIYVIRERKRSAPKRSLLLRAIVEEQECERLKELYGELPYSVSVIKAYRGAK